VIYCNRHSGASRAAQGAFYDSTDKFKAEALFEIELITISCMEMSYSCDIIFNGGMLNGPSQKSSILDGGFFVSWHQLACFRSVERAKVQETLFT